MMARVAIRQGLNTCAAKVLAALMAVVRDAGMVVGDCC